MKVIRYFAAFFVVYLIEVHAGRTVGDLGNERSVSSSNFMDNLDADGLIELVRSKRHPNDMVCMNSDMVCVFGLEFAVNLIRFFSSFCPLFF